jgi:ribosomal protein S27AE
MTNVQSIATLDEARKFIQTLIKTEVRCCKCNKLLAKYNKNGLIAGEIKCGRCGYIETF